ncbi:MAG: DUF2188 domain-containing protein [Patescibacteria group bacterium]
MRKILYKTNQNNPQIKAYKEAVEKGRQSQHVLPREGAWVVKRAGSQRVTQVFTTQLEARQFAEGIARNQGTALFVHGKDGRIKDRRDF